MRDSTGKVALVTGGSRGIGAAVVKQFASQGADVAVVYAGNQELAEALCAQCAADYGVKAIAYRCDVADFAAVKDTVNQVKKDFRFRRYPGKQRWDHAGRPAGDDEGRGL